MNREQIHRGKRVDSGTWVHGHFCKTFWWDDERSKHYITRSRTKREVIPDTVTQSLGVNDINEIPIFEHDFLKDVNNNIYLVLWSKTHCGFYLGTPTGEIKQNGKPVLKDFFSPQDKWDQFQIIGNLYDTPELLKEKEGN